MRVSCNVVSLEAASNVPMDSPFFLEVYTPNFVQKRLRKDDRCNTFCPFFPENR